LSNLLAFEPTLEHEVHMVNGVGVLAVGIYVVRISENGLVALRVKGVLLTMSVTPDNPVSADPTVTTAYTSGLWPGLKTNFDTRPLDKQSPYFFTSSSRLISRTGSLE
jgi:uncharacterized protein (AIM24 family)